MAHEHSGRFIFALRIICVGEDLFLVAYQEEILVWSPHIATLTSFYAR